MTGKNALMCWRRTRLHRSARIFLAQPHYVFLLLAIMLAAIYASALDPFRDYTHETERFAHVVYLAHRALGGAPNTIPEDIPAFLKAEQTGRQQHYTFGFLRIWQLHGQGVDRNKAAEFHSTANASMYSPAAYAPQLIACMLGLLFGLSPAAILMLATLFTCAVALALGFSTLRLMPICRWQICALLLLPTMGKNRLLVMPDAISIECILMWVAYVLRCYADGTMLRRRQICFLAIIAAIIGQCKTVYIPVIALMAILPENQFGGRKAKWRVTTICLALAFFSAAAWSAYVFSAFNVGDSSFSAARLQERTQLIEAHPWSYMVHVLSQIFSWEQNRWWLVNLFAWRSESAISPYVPWLIEYFILWISSALWRTEGEKYCKFSMFQRLLCGIIFVVTAGAIIHILQITCIYADLFSGRLEALGRYFLPLIPFIWIGLYRGQPLDAASTCWLKGILILFPLLLNIFVLRQLIML